MIDARKRKLIERCGLTREFYSQAVNNYIREKYTTVSEELSILRKKETDPEAWQEYFDYCEQCKARAREEYNISK